MRLAACGQGKSWPGLIRRSLFTEGEEGQIRSIHSEARRTEEGKVLEQAGRGPRGRTVGVLRDLAEFNLQKW